MHTLTDKLSKIESINKEAYSKVKNRLNMLTKPVGSLGQLEDLAERYAAIHGKDSVKLEKKVIFTFAGDHGVAEEGVSAFPQEVTPQMVFNFLGGGAAINVLARHNNIDLIVVDMGVAYEFDQSDGLIINKIAKGTNNIAKGPAMTRDQAQEAIKTGINLADKWAKKGVDIFGTGDMGIANTTASSAIVAAIGKADPEKITGRGTGIDDNRLKHKIEIIKKALEINKPDPRDPIDVLAKVGGFEIGGITGLIIGAALNKIPIVIDGFISGAGALLAVKLEPKIKEYIFTSHKSVEAGHKIIFNTLEMKPLFDFNMRLGEGTGAAIGIGLIESSVKILTEMATFKEAEVAESND